MLFNDLKNMLSESQLKVLGFLAYTGNSMGDRTMSSFCRVFGMDELAVRAIIRELFFNKLLENNSTVVSLNVLPILMWLVENKPEWIDGYKGACISGQVFTNTESLNFVSNLINNEATFLRREISYSTESKLPMLCPLITNELFQKELSLMPFSTFRTFIEVLIPWLLKHDIDVSDSLLKAWDKNDNYKERGESEWAMTLLYTYFAKGEIPDTCNIPNTWHKSVIDGTKCLIEGQYAEAKSHFQTALKGEQKNVFFNDYICNYLYALSLILVVNSDSRLKMYDIANLSSHNMKKEVLPLKVLATYHKDNKHVVDDVSLRTFCDKAQGSHAQGLLSIALVLSWLMRRNCGINTQNVSKPNLWLLRHERAIFNNSGKIEFVTSPIVSRIQSSQSNAFGNTNASVYQRQNGVNTKTFPVNSQPSHVRVPVVASVKQSGNVQTVSLEESYKTGTSLVYVVKGDCRLYPYVKSENLESKSSSLREISIDDYRRGRVGTNNVSDVDRQIWNAWKSSGYNFVLDKILPALSNNGKLYTCLSGSFLQAKAVFFTPFIEVLESPAGFKIASNIRRSDIATSGNVICKVADSKIQYTTIAASVKPLLLQILSNSEYAFSYEEHLHQLCIRLKDVIEVRGDIYAAGCAPVTISGSPKLSIRVSEKNKNAKSSRTIMILANPIDGVAYNLFPGEGNAIIKAVIQGKKMYVQRNLDVERSNKSKLYDYLQNIGCSLQPMPGKARSISIDIEKLLLLMKFVSENSENYSLSWQCTRLNVKELDKKDIKIYIKHKENWLELEGDVTINDDCMINVRDFFNEVMSGNDRFIKIDEGNYVMIHDKLRNELKNIASAFNDNGHKLKATKLAATLVSESISDLSNDPTIDFLLNNKEKIEASKDSVFEIPETLNAHLRPYQNEGFQWMSRLAYWGAGACLADDMGLGKTLQSISFMLSRAEEGASIIVVPASVVKNWESEIHRFAPSLKTHLLNAKKSKDDIIQKADANDILIVTYGLIVSLAPKLKEKQWCVICLDEAHTIKNKSTKTSSAVMELQSLYKLALTGTPIQNNLSELWNIFQFTNPGLLGSFEQFKKKYANPIMNNQDLDRQELLKRIIAPFMMRRTKLEVAKELPQKNEETILVNLGDGEMEAYEYIRIKAQEKAAKAKAEKGNKGNIDILSEITKLRLAACDIKLQNSNWNGLSSKIKAFESLVNGILENEDSPQILVFSQFTSFLKMIEGIIKTKEIKYLYLDGATSIKQRANLVEQFQSGEVPIFLISLQAGGVGLNLTAANHVILLDPWWNPAIEQQAIDRAYRIGQQRDVTIHHLIACNTIEEKIVRLQKTKNDMATALLTGQELGGNITYDEMRELITR